ncbi:CoA-binding protein, partial [Romboutsia sp. 13368]|uniref:CoA-binding protein n=1 Tax=Romboutsia sp. 13368 TaxID=2708053 RepID=UPI0025D1C28E
MNLLKNRSWAVVIIDKSEDSKEVKFIKLLKNNNCKVVGINFNNYNSEEFSIYESLKDVPHNIDVVAILKESVHNYYIIDEMELLDIKNIYFDKD